MIRDKFITGLTFDELRENHPANGLIHLSWNADLEIMLSQNNTDQIYLADYVRVEQINSIAAAEINTKTNSLIQKSLAEAEFRYFRIPADLLEQLVTRESRSVNFVIYPVTAKKHPIRIEMSNYVYNEEGKCTGVYLVFKTTNEVLKKAKDLSSDARFLNAMAELEEVLLTGNNIENILFDSTATNDGIDLVENYSSMKVEKSPFFIN